MTAKPAATTSSTTQPVYAIVGNDRFLRGEALCRVLEALADGAPPSPTRFEGTDAAIALVLDEVRTPSLLGDRRIAIVDNADPFITANRATLERYCANPATESSLILLCNTMPKNTKLYKAIHKIGSVVGVEAPKGRGVASWAVERARTAYGKRLGGPAAGRLIDHLGDSLGTIDAELSKLSAFVGERSEITPDDIGALTGHHREEKIFAVTDAMSVGDVSGALEQWEQVLATDRAAPGRAVAGLAWGVRRLLDARKAFEKGADLRELSRRFYTDPAVLKRRLERVTTDGLAAQQQDLLNADVAVKTGASTVATAVEKFILKHSRTTPPLSQGRTS